MTGRPHPNLHYQPRSAWKNRYETNGMTTFVHTSVMLIYTFRMELLLG